jgi:hypothetical protein
MSGQGERLATPALAALARSNAEGDALRLSGIGRRLGQRRPGDLVTVIFGDVAFGDSERALRIRRAIIDLARETCSFETKLFSVQLPLPTNFLHHRQDGLAKGEVDRSHGWKGPSSHRLLEEIFHSSNLGQGSSLSREYFFGPRLFLRH